MEPRRGDFLHSFSQQRMLGGRFWNNFQEIPRPAGPHIGPKNTNTKWHFVKDVDADQKSPTEFYLWNLEDKKNTRWVLIFTDND